MQLRKSMQLLLWGGVLTFLDVLWPDAADGRPVVRNLLRGFDVFIIDAFPKVVDDRNSC